MTKRPSYYPFWERTGPRRRALTIALAFTQLSLRLRSRCPQCRTKSPLHKLQCSRRSS